MPLAQPPTRGFSEFQRTGPWDSPTLWEQPALTTAAPILSGLMDVSRWAYLAGEMTAGGGSAFASMSWYSDAAGSLLLGSRGIVLDSNMGNFAQLRVPNLGPFVTITASKVGAGASTFQAQLIGTNRDHPLELVPAAAVLIFSNAVTVVPANPEVIYPADYYAGPTQFYVNSTQAGAVNLEYLDSGGTWQRLQSFTITAATNTQLSLLTPEGAWRVRFTNTSGVNATVTVTVTPSLTGGT